MNHNGLRQNIDINITIFIDSKTYITILKLKQINIVLFRGIINMLVKNSTMEVSNAIHKS